MCIWVIQELCAASRRMINNNRYMGISRRGLWFTLSFIAAGCVLARPPLKDIPKVVATPEPGQVSVATHPANTIGDVQPVYISIANGTDIPRAIVPSQIFAMDEQGQ